MSYRLKHALHNESVCKTLLNLRGEKFYDWVVTTAFYSAIHFVEHKLFPLSEVGRTFNTFNEYYNFSKSQSSLPKFPDKHRFKSNLVKKYLRTISGDYNFLLTQCFASRYSNYNVSEPMAKQCVKKMDIVKKACMI